MVLGTLNGLLHTLLSAQRSFFFLRHFQIQCIVDATSLCDHLISLSSPSSVEDKRCGLIWSFLDNACSVLVLLPDGLPQIVSWLMLLTKDSADPVDS